MLLADLAGEKTASCGDSLEVAGAPIPGLIVMDECHPAKAQQINIKALAAILEGALKIAPDAPPEKLAAHTASLYQRCIEEDLITPTGIGPGRMAKAS
ncbi:hypothetical protein SAMN05660652_03569 [Propionivibrio dicarboxylicus]|uniref:Uncharacterized protein n=2 Tax=Propionivibrio dicarboxylicus TaxID=83767 RepID=A0A1G8L853_9RHOO|nr:hypothetical protein SAMN05660652_03569 [Propionivibrio dicarboxylicus]